MSRSKVIITAVGLAVLAVIVPLVGVLWWSWSLALDAERERLGFYAERVLDRAERSFADAVGALRSIEADVAQPCSDGHIARMRMLTLGTLNVDEIGYFADGFLKCTSWGPIAERVERVKPDLVMKDGVAATLGVRPMVNRDKPMIALQVGNHNVLVDPTRFVDVVVEPTMSLALVGPSGRAVAGLNTPSPSQLAALVADPERARSRGLLFGVATRNGWTAVASEPGGTALSALRRQQAMLLPFALLISGLVVALVYLLCRKRLSPTGELALAVRNREFVVHYQPIVDLRTGGCVGAEALVRWRRPDGTLVRPDLFIPVAEESGLILSITDQVIDAVVAELGTAMTADRELHVAINLSAGDVASGRAVSVVATKIRGTGVETRQIWLEATERGFMDIGPARQALERARGAGHRVAIDDFGTGYSSLQYLHDLPIDALKIDKSFVDAIGQASAGSAVIPHIIEMGRALSLEMVAEGVETEVQRDYLAERGVQYGQGWLFGCPMPAQEFLAFLDKSRRPRPLEPSTSIKAGIAA